jgi:hypothetical protein
LEAGLVGEAVGRLFFGFSGWQGYFVLLPIEKRDFDFSAGEIAELAGDVVEKINDNY